MLAEVAENVKISVKIIRVEVEEWERARERVECGEGIRFSC